VQPVALYSTYTLVVGRVLFLSVYVLLFLCRADTYYVVYVGTRVVFILFPRQWREAQFVV